MAGIPFHAADGYIHKQLDQGVTLAICDQVETPKKGELVKRALTRILSPGTTIEDNQLESTRNHTCPPGEVSKHLSACPCHFHRALLCRQRRAVHCGTRRLHLGASYRERQSEDYSHRNSE